MISVRPGSADDDRGLLDAQSGQVFFVDARYLALSQVSVMLRARRSSSRRSGRPTCAGRPTRRSAPGAKALAC